MCSKLAEHDVTRARPSDHLIHITLTEYGRSQAREGIPCAKSGWNTRWMVLGTTPASAEHYNSSSVTAAGATVILHSIWHICKHQGLGLHSRRNYTSHRVTWARSDATTCSYNRQRCELYGRLAANYWHTTICVVPPTAHCLDFCRQCPGHMWNKIISATEGVLKLESLRWFSQRRSRTQVLCARCVRCDVSSDRNALPTSCVMTLHNATFRGVRTPAGTIIRLWHTNSNSTEIFVQCTYPKFHHPMFTRSAVIVLTVDIQTRTNTTTNKQTLPKTSNVLRYATTLGIISKLFQRQWTCWKIFTSGNKPVK